MDTVQTIAVGQVGGNLRLRINPSAFLLLIGYEDRNGEDREVNAETNCGRAGGQETRGAKVRRGDVGGGHELLHHIRTRRGDVEGEGQRAGGHLCGDQVTLLVENLIGGNILTFPGCAILHNLTEGLRSAEVGQFGGGIVIDGGEDDEVALTNKRGSCGVNLVDNGCHFLSGFYLLKLLIVFHLKLRVVTLYPEA